MAGAACTPSTWVTCSRKCSTCSAPIRACGGEARAMSAVIKLEGAAAREQAVWALLAEVADPEIPVLRDRKSTRLNSSHSQISYAVFCLKKKKTDATAHCYSRLSTRRCSRVVSH